MSEKKTYLYDYQVQEIVMGSKQPIANYSSDAAPPQIGSIIDPGEFSADGYKKYRVTKVEIIPRRHGESSSNSDSTYVIVFVEKVPK
jgi:hypothetical protein